MNKLNVLFIINSLEIGGAETFLLRLIKELSNTNKINPYLFVLSPEKNDVKFETYFYKETHVQLIPKYKKTSGLKDELYGKLNGLSKKILNKTFYEKLLKTKEDNYYKVLLTKKYKIDLINSHLLSSDIFAMDYLKPLIKKPLIISNHGCYNDYEDFNTIRRIITNMDGLTYVAQKNLDPLYKTGEPITKNKKLIYNGLEQPKDITFIKRESIGISKNDFVVGQVSRSIETKGLEIAIKSIIFLKENHRIKNLQLILAAPENDHYNFLKRKYKAHDYIHFVGQTMQPLEWVGIFDVGILPTYFTGESCPSTIIEYLSCGKPVISTNAGEIPNMIKSENESAGIIVIEKDEQNIPNYLSFSDAILKYYSDRELLNYHATIALKAFDKFRIEKTAQNYMNIYKNAIGKKDIT